MNHIVQVFVGPEWSNYQGVSRFNIEYYTNGKIKENDVLDISIIGEPHIKTHCDCYKNDDVMFKCFVNRIIITLKPHCQQYKSNRHQTQNEDAICEPNQQLTSLSG